MKAAIGQDSHRFEETPGKPLILGGVVFPGEVGLLANSDGDVVLHAITNAVSGITGRNILGRWLMRCAKAASPIQRNTCGKP
ncbi:MAG: 2-C-methyl-D-erythritol 2,4-cyclodiphosphate synthase [Angelakisella sp.]